MYICYICYTQDKKLFQLEKFWGIFEHLWDSLIHTNKTVKRQGRVGEEKYALKRGAPRCWITWNPGACGYINVADNKCKTRAHPLLLNPLNYIWINYIYYYTIFECVKSNSYSTLLFQEIEKTQPSQQSSTGSQYDSKMTRLTELLRYYVL